MTPNVRAICTIAVSIGEVLATRRIAALLGEGLDPTPLLVSAEANAARLRAEWPAHVHTVEQATGATL